MSIWTPPYSELNTTPAVEDVASTDDIPYAWNLDTATGQTPSTASVTVTNYRTGASAAAVKSGSASVSNVSGSTCTVTQRFTGFVAGTIYEVLVVVTTASGLDFTARTYFRCVS